MFHTPKVRNKSKIVYVHYLCQGSVAEKMLTNEQSDVQTEDELVGEKCQSVTESDNRVPLREYY